MADTATLSELTATPHASPFPGEEPKVVRLALDAGERVEPHRHPDRRIVCYLLSGTMALDLDEETHELAAGDLIRFDGRREVAPRAIEDCEALLVLALRPDA